MTTEASVRDPRCPPTPCREWQGTRTWNGYGTRSIPGIRSPQLVHRWVVKEIDGPIAKGLVVAHLCHNRACFRYDHLKVMTQRENLLMSRANMARPQVGEANSFAKLTEGQVREIRERADQASRTALGREFGVTRQCIGRIVDRKTWQHVP